MVFLRLYYVCQTGIEALKSDEGCYSQTVTTLSCKCPGDIHKEIVW